VLSDRISIVIDRDPNSKNLALVTITLDSDPFSASITNPGATLLENGTQQDVSSRLFNMASDPTHPCQRVLASAQAHFDGVVTSDVPEPRGLVLTAMSVLGWLGCRRRYKP